MANCLTIEEINSKYWNIRDSKWKGLSFTFQSEEAKTNIAALSIIVAERGFPKEANKISNAKILVKWSKGKEPIAEVSEEIFTRNPELDWRISTVFTGYKQMAVGFTNQWLGMVQDPMIFEFKNYPVISKLGDSVRVSFIKREAFETYTFDNGYESASFTNTTPGRNIEGKFTFVKKAAWHLPKTVFMKIGPMTMSYEFTYDDQNPIPSSGVTTVESPGQNIRVTAKITAAKFSK